MDTAKAAVIAVLTELEAALRAAAEGNRKAARHQPPEDRAEFLAEGRGLLIAADRVRTKRESCGG